MPLYSAHVICSLTCFLLTTFSTGYIGIITKIVRVDDVYAAGKVTDHVIALPTTKTALNTFMNGQTLSCIVHLLVSSEIPSLLLLYKGFMPLDIILTLLPFGRTDSHR
jgi:hypothetical protein